MLRPRRWGHINSKCRRHQFERPPPSPSEGRGEVIKAPLLAVDAGGVFDEKLRRSYLHSEKKEKYTFSFFSPRFFVTLPSTMAKLLRLGKKKE